MVGTLLAELSAMAKGGQTHVNESQPNSCAGSSRPAWGERHERAEWRDAVLPTEDKSETQVVAHRSFSTSRVFQFLLALGAQSGAEKGVLWWASHHRWDRKYADTEQRRAFRQAPWFCLPAHRVALQQAMERYRPHAHSSSWIWPHLPQVRVGTTITTTFQAQPDKGSSGGNST